MIYLIRYVILIITKLFLVITIAITLLFILMFYRNYDSLFPLEIAHEEGVFYLPLSLNDLNETFNFDSIYHCSLYQSGYIAEKYSTSNAASLSAFYLSGKSSYDFMGLSFYYPYDSLQNEMLKNTIEKQWNRQFQYIEKNESINNDYWFMPISRHITILLFKRKTSRQFVSIKNKPTVYMLRNVSSLNNQFVVAFVRPYNNKFSFYYKYTSTEGFAWDD
jgi:hypothetical protein